VSAVEINIALRGLWGHAVFIYLRYRDAGYCYSAVQTDFVAITQFRDFTVLGKTPANYRS
jgi:hypothetical protein